MGNCSLSLYLQTLFPLVVAASLSNIFIWFVAACSLLHAISLELLQQTPRSHSRDLKPDPFTKIIQRTRPLTCLVCYTLRQTRTNLCGRSHPRNLLLRFWAVRLTLYWCWFTCIRFMKAFDKLLFVQFVVLILLCWNEAVRECNTAACFSAWFGCFLFISFILELLINSLPVCD